ncbi:MAG: TIGR02449 family protein [Pseudomonadales bacterium]
MSNAPTHSAKDAANAPASDDSLSDWQALESKVNEMIELTTTLARENKALRTQQRNWSSERAKLIEKNELAKSRVESMITRLKALEQDA